MDANRSWICSRNWYQYSIWYDLFRYLLAKFLKLPLLNFSNLSLWETGSIAENIIKILYRYRKQLYYIVSQSPSSKPFLAIGELGYWIKKCVHDLGAIILGCILRFQIERISTFDKKISSTIQNDYYFLIIQICVIPGFTL